MDISVIIPTRNRHELLRRTLESLCRQTYPSDRFEVIVVDNASTDDTPVVCADFTTRFKVLRRVIESTPGLHAGRHAGCRAAAAPILVYGDDDIDASPTWLEGVAAALTDPQVALVGGKCLPRYECEPPDWVERMWEESPYGRLLGCYSLLDFGPHPRTIPAGNVWGCNFSIRKDVLKRLDGFHPDGMPQELLRFRGDGESGLAAELARQNLTAVYEPAASVHHFVPRSRLTVEYLFNRSFAQGVSDSYAKIRQSGSFELPAELLRSGWGKHIAALAAGGKRLLDRLIQRGYRTIKRAMRSGHENGFHFHQREVHTDPRLLEWVLRENYWNADCRDYLAHCESHRKAA